MGPSGGQRENCIGLESRGALQDPSVSLVLFFLFLFFFLFFLFFFLFFFIISFSFFPLHFFSFSLVLRKKEKENPLKHSLLSAVHQQNTQINCRPRPLGGSSAPAWLLLRRSVEESSLRLAPVKPLHLRVRMKQDVTLLMRLFYILRSFIDALRSFAQQEMTGELHTVFSLLFFNDVLKKVFGHRVFRQDDHTDYLNKINLLQMSTLPFDNCFSLNILTRR